ncbi:hypothetical protein Slin15195_G092860 [Septoria linicola]|uniref:Uncharacterized protein n=1 Tax=Septoria linicola TaxID=215465 RepID=A0A9Q9EMW2_9PEZI|nr:hypothetical protein Slin15195_G092860 [Septoria linicola]
MQRNVLPPASKAAERGSSNSSAKGEANVSGEVSPVKKSHWGLVTAFMLDLILGLMAAAFIVYAFLITAYRDVPIQDHPVMAKRLMEASRIGPTVYPILFAVVLSRFINTLSLWLLEGGSRLGLLDLLAGNTTVVGTIFTQITLRSVSIVGILLIATWSLSPIGGQASLRVLSSANATTSAATLVRYMSSNNTYVD